ncbi:DUF5985 family protein [Planctomyces sp. SH-PL14]|uniref:DUF5985 family protein n=1 Tax=Planctomyces sp. SH-PL14 TaxID=1632864 RepID=UPI00078B3754|nr:DUF5985 family protein [Planctomyces sp. SH-PL14]AMV20835.1 hypothetical protein VT03_23235 [Planctomyces sp. SH-PL14]
MDMYLSGMITGLNCVVALIFMKFWVQTRDRLFLWFSIAFVALGLSRLRATIDRDHEWFLYAHMLRFAAFLTILAAIVDKNLKSRQSP